MTTAMNSLDLLGSEFDALEQHPDQLDKFMVRAAAALEAELVAAGVEFHAVHDYVRALGQDQFSKAANLTLWSEGTVMQCEATNGLGYINNAGIARDRVPAITSLCDSELKRVFGELAVNIACQAKRICFSDMYCPKAVHIARQCNNLRVAFRYVQAWDPVRSGSVMRFDVLFKDLAA